MAWNWWPCIYFLSSGTFSLNQMLFLHRNLPGFFRNVLNFHLFFPNKNGSHQHFSGLARASTSCTSPKRITTGFLPEPSWANGWRVSAMPWRRWWGLDWAPGMRQSMAGKDFLNQNEAVLEKVQSKRLVSVSSKVSWVLILLFLFVGKKTRISVGSIQYMFGQHIPNSLLDLHFETCLHSFVYYCCN